MADTCALVVDDDEDVRRLVMTVVRRAGATVDEASDGEQAIQRLKSKTYDIVILDLMMPDVTGFGVLRFMSETGLETPVIILSAAPPNLLNAVDARRVAAVLRKPFDVDQLTAIVRKLCGMSEA